MKRRIFLIFVLFTAIISMIGAAALTKVYYDFYSDNVKADLRAEAYLIKDYLQSNQDSGDYRVLLAKTDQEVSPFTRITVIAQSGAVLFDTDAATATLENHLDRPEIISAQKTGSGEAVRYSATLGKDAYYYALKLDNGAFIRLSRQLDSIWTVFSGIIPPVIAILLLMLALSLIAASILTKSIIKPINKTAETIDAALAATDANIYDAPVYEELIPFVRQIRSQREKIEQQINTLKAERDTISDISASMREGLILLDKNKHIISINNSARSMLNISPAKDYVGENISKLTRNSDLLGSISAAIAKNEETSFTDENAGYFLRYYISPVNIESKEKAEGAMVFILDVSQEVKAERIRRDFAANVSHELKTPLTSISGFAEMISGGMIKDVGDIRKSAQSITKEAARLLLLINEIMRLSEIESGFSDQDTLTEVYLPDILSETVNALAPALASKKIKIAYASADLTVKANRQMLYELLFNLIDNAIKYNKENGGIDIAIKETDGIAQVSVADTGIGIDPQYRDRIFERFYRVDKSRSKQSGGTGLGLSIVKHIVEYHQWSISLDSIIGEGTTVTVCMPVIKK